MQGAATVALSPTEHDVGRSVLAIRASVKVCDHCDLIPTIAVHTVSTTGSDLKAERKVSDSHTQKSFDALSEEPSPLKGCVRWESLCVHGENHGKRERENGEGGCGHRKDNALSVMWKPLDEQVFRPVTLQRPLVSANLRANTGANLCRPRSEP